MTQNIRFGTYNIGRGIVDYQSMLESNDQEKAKLDTVISERAANIQMRGEDAKNLAKKNLMEEAEDRVARKIANLLDVIALQEVATYNENRKFITTLEALGFKIVHASDNTSGSSCAIAVKKEIIGLVSDISIQSESQPDRYQVYGQEIGGIVLKTKSGAQIAFASLHSWDMKLYPPTTVDKLYSSDDQAKQKWALHYGQEAVNLLNSQKVDAKIIGGDMNNNPDNYKEGFDVFTRANYTTQTPDGPTNVNRDDPQYKERKVDFIFTNFHKSLLSRIFNAFYSIFFTTFQVTSTGAQVLPEFDFTMEGSCSDHKPVGLTLTIKKHEGLISKILS